MLGAVSQWEKSVITSKLRAARARKKRETGRCEGVLPFGAKDGEQVTLERMRELHRKPRGEKRRSFGEIARVLEEEGRGSRSGKPWSRSSVRAILSR